MIRLLLSAVLLSVTVAAAQAASWTREQTNSGTSSFLAEELRGCNEEPRAGLREACRDWTRDQLQYHRDDRRRRPGWAQDRWR